MKRFFLSNVFFLLVLTLSVFTIYGKSIFFGFSYYDDDSLIIDNVNYISDIRNIPYFFTESCFHSKDYLYYRHLLTLSFSIESLLFKTNPEIYHFDNILLFLAAVFLIYILLLKLNFNKNLSKLVCFLFSVHPVFTSCIVWIPARNDTLFVIFLCLSLICFINYINFNEIKLFILQCLFFTAALFTKETAIVLIPVYCLLIYCFNYKVSKKQIMYNLYVLPVILLAYFILRAKAVPEPDLIYFIVNWKLSVTEILTGLAAYTDKFLFPDYMPVILYNVSLDTGTIIVNIAAILIIVFFCYKRYITKKTVLFGLFWITAFLFPTFMQREYAFLLHRFMPASIGAIIIITAAAEKILEKNKNIKIYFVIFFVLLAAVFSYLSYLQENKYKNANKYWIYAYTDAKNYHIVCQGLAKRYLYAGNYKRAKELLFEAKKLKNLYSYDLDIATVSIAEGKLDEAENRLLRLIKLKEAEPALRYLSEIYLAKGDIQKSFFYAEKALAADSDDKLLLKHIEKLKSLNR